MPLNLEETFREFAGDAASGLGTELAPAPAPVPARQAAVPAALPAEVDEDAGEAIVSKNFKIMGDLNCHDVLRIEGYVEGNIECRTLTVCESARIKGNIRAKTVEMSGKVIGTIEAGTLTLHRASIVAGDLVVHEQLGIEPGAHFEGSCKRVSAKKPAQQGQATKQTNSQATAQAPRPTARAAE
jgi:cytoskeletal protein CcmA (bactofilin family)